MIRNSVNLKEVLEKALHSLSYGEEKVVLTDNLVKALIASKFLHAEGTKIQTLLKSCQVLCEELENVSTRLSYQGISMIKFEKDYYRIEFRFLKMEDGEILTLAAKGYKFHSRVDFLVYAKSLVSEYNSDKILDQWSLEMKLPNTITAFNSALLEERDALIFEKAILTGSYTPKESIEKFQELFNV